MHGAAPGPGSQAAIADFCGCRERSLPPGRFIQMGRSGDGAFPGAAELRIFLSFPLSLPDDGRLATSRNTPSGVSQEAEVNRCRIHAGRQLHTSDSPERRVSVVVETS